MKKILLLGIAATLAGCSNNTQQQEFVPPPVPVQTAGVQVRDVPLYLEAMGVIEPSQMAEVVPQISGMIQNVHFTEGQWIEQGELLYTLDDAPHAIRLLELRAQRDQDLAHLNNAKKKLERYKSLTTQDLIAQVEWDELETQVALHEAMVKADEARLLNAQRDLQHCKIAAPIAGFAGKSALHVGNMASSVSLVTLTQIDPLFVDFMITQQELLQVTTPSAAIQVYAAGGQECLGLGQVIFMDHRIDPESGMLAARAQIANAHKTLLPGQSVRVHLFFDTKENAQLIPMRAIRTNQEGPYIFAVKEDNTVEMRCIKLGSEEKGHIIVESGLEGVDKVVTEGQLRLFPGSKIKEIAQ